jgi:hypothetical protein
MAWHHPGMPRARLTIFANQRDRAFGPAWEGVHLLDWIVVGSADKCMGDKDA